MHLAGQVQRRLSCLCGSARTRRILASRPSHVREYVLDVLGADRRTKQSTVRMKRNWWSCREGLGGPACYHLLE